MCRCPRLSSAKLTLIVRVLAWKSRFLTLIKSCVNPCWAQPTAPVGSKMFDFNISCLTFHCCNGSF